MAPRATAKINLVSDVLSVGGGVLGASLLSGVAITETTWMFALAAVCAWLMGAFVLRFYDPWANRLALDDAALLSLMILGEAMLLVLARAWLPDRTLPRVVDFALPLALVVLTLRVFLFRRLARLEPAIDEVLIVGVGPAARCTAEDLRTKRWPRRNVRAFLRYGDEPRVETVGEVPVLGAANELEAILKAHPVNEVYFAGTPQRHGPAIQAGVAACERLGIPFALPACPYRLGRARVSNLVGTTDGYLHFVNVRSNPQQAALKRLFDIVASAAALVVLSPLLLTVAALIKLTSRGPIFFKQVRVGLYGRQFHMFKFRSMVVNAEALQEKLRTLNEQTGPVFKMQNDPRITRIGRFIRKFSIDELPQLLNVLRGEMSVVGPRPPLPKEVAQYEPWQRRRLSVRPGLTCIWQVSGRNQISFKEWMYLDMRYIDHWSLGQDLNLVLKTVPVVLTGRGAS